MRFSRDRRGQSVVIGTVILFGFLILALSLYQVQVVPQQNGQTEFEHFEEVQNDLVELRNAISSAGQSERPQFIDVKLGTNYQTRLFAINPPDPAGTLQTSQSYNITIDDGTNDPVNISTKFVRYRPGYNELQVGSIWYDNSVLYLDERDSGSRAVIIEDQNLVVDNGSLQITALQNNFRASGTRRVSVELYPADTAANISQLSGPVNVSIPTRLSADDGYWNESIENTSSVTYLEVDDDGYNSSEVSALRLRVNSPDNVSVNSVGIQAEPSEGAVRDNVGPVESGETGDQSLEFSFIEVRDESTTNPGGQNGKVVYDVEYTVDDTDGEFDRVEIEFNNTDNPGVSELITSTALSSTVTHDPDQKNADFSDEYEITIRLYGSNGEVVDERVVIQDTADGNDP